MAARVAALGEGLGRIERDNSPSIRAARNGLERVHAAFFPREMASRWKNPCLESPRSSRGKEKSMARPCRDGKTRRARARGRFAPHIEGELSLSIRPRPSPRAATRAANTAAAIAIAATPSRIEFFRRRCRRLEMRQIVLRDDCPQGSPTSGEIRAAVGVSDKKSVERR